MANYIIIGGDQKEYGPITTDDVRKWIAEGRLNAQSMMKAESDAGWRPLSAFPEFADAFGGSAAAPSTPPVISPAELLERDYELDIGGCISRGWELVKNNFGTLFGSFVVLIVIRIVCGAAVNKVSELISATEAIRQIAHLTSLVVLALVMGPMMGGLYYVFLRSSRSQPTNIGEVFTGFQKNFKELFLGYLVVALVLSLCLTPYNIINDTKVLPILEQMRHAQPTDMQNLMSQLWSALFSTLPILLISMVPVTYLSVNWQFTLPLIIDKQMPFWTAMKTSWKMVHKHWWQVFGLAVVIGLVSLAGVLGCCIGVLFTIPIGIAALMIAYESIFSESQTR
jgi:membrane-anchored glycerophosphoryl diester phosphodiesterase (GDPDase)